MALQVVRKTAENDYQAAMLMSPRRSSGQPDGFVGTLNQAGRIYDEDDNATFDDLFTSLPVFHKMAKSCYKVAAGLNLRKAAVRDADWEFKSDNEADDEIVYRLNEQILNNPNQPWSQTINHIMLAERDGFSILAPWFVRRGDHVQLYKFCPRLSKTIYAHTTDDRDGSLKSITQFGMGDDGKYKYADIQAKEMLLFVRNQEGNNWYGESILRPCWFDWLSMTEDSTYLQIYNMRWSSGALMALLPEGAAGDETNTATERGAFCEMLRKFVSGAQNFIAYPNEKSKPEAVPMPAANSLILDSIKMFGENIGKALNVQFMDAATADTGNRAAVIAQIKQMLGSLEEVLKEIKYIFNSQFLPWWLYLNTYQPKGKIELTTSKLTKQFDVEEIIRSASMAVTSGLMVKGETTDEWTRDQMGIPYEERPMQMATPDPSKPDPKEPMKKDPMMEEDEDMKEAA